jgi:tripartite-type tricarboxylate transporter receptor subunit TctC
MKLPRRRFLQLAAGAAALPAFSGVAVGQTYPSRPITMISGIPPGSGTDTFARIFGERMKSTLGQSLIVESITGAGGTIGTARAAQAAPDGYTLSVGNVGTHVVSPATYPNIQYHPLNDFEPVALFATNPYWLLAKNALPPKDLKELIAWLKANPDKASLAVVGTGGLDQIVGTYFQQQTGTRFQFVPYRGGGPAIQDLVAGHVDLRFDPVSGSLAQVRSGQLKAYAVLAKTRVPAAPDIPTTDELGVPGLHVTFWFGLWAPKGTPKPIIDTLSAAVAEAFNDPAVQRRIAELGAEAPPPELRTAEAFGAFHKAEVEKWWPFIKAANIKVE